MKMERIEQELLKTGWNDTWWRHDTKSPERIERELNEKNLEGRIERVVEKINNEKNKLAMVLSVTSQDHKVITDHKRKWLDSWEERRNVKHHFKRIRRINYTSKSKKERYLSSFDNNLDEHLRNELNHENHHEELR